MDPIFYRTLNVTATRARPVRESDGQGGWVDADEDTATLPCRIIPATADAELVAHQLGVRVTKWVSALPGVDVRRGDRLEADFLDDGGAVVRVVQTVSSGHHVVIGVEERQS